MVVELAAGPQIEHGADAERRDPREVGALDAMDAVGSVEQAPPHDPAAGGVAAEIAEVEGAFERDPPRSGERSDRHARNVPAACNTQLADT